MYNPPYIQLPRDILRAMSSPHLREQSRSLRRQGKSISEIANLLDSSKSTVSYWCRDVALSPGQQRTLAKVQRRAGELGRLRAAEQKRKRRLFETVASMNMGARDAGVLRDRDLFILGLALYWGEGYKKGNEECGFTNSDPNIIRAFIAWLKHTYGIHTSDLILRVSINNVHTARVKAVERHWSNITKVPISQFTTASLIRTISKKAYPNLKSHFGTLRVKVRRGTALRRRILGSIAEIERQLKQYDE